MKDRTKRLGVQGGAKAILRHPWFNEIDLVLLLEGKVEAPFKPPPFGTQKSEKYFHLRNGSAALKESVLGSDQMDVIQT